MKGQTPRVIAAFKNRPLTRREWWVRRDEMVALARERSQEWSVAEDNAFATLFYGAMLESEGDGKWRQLA